MRMTITLQISSEKMSLDYFSRRIGYNATTLTIKGSERVPPRALPKANLWNGGPIITDIFSIDDGINACIDRYPDMANHINTLRAECDDINCTVYVGLRPFSNDFIITIEESTMEKLAKLRCSVSIEYFGD